MNKTPTPTKTTTAWKVEGIAGYGEPFEKVLSTSAGSVTEDNPKLARNVAHLKAMEQAGWTAFVMGAARVTVGDRVIGVARFEHD